MTARRPPRHGRAAVLGVVLVALTACGSVHPGAAAVIEDTRISFDEVDPLSEAYCQATIAIANSQGSPPEPRPGIDARRTVVTTLLQLEIARRAADSLGVTVEPSAYTANEQQYEPLLEAVGEEYADEVSQLIRANAEAVALQTAIGAHRLGQDVSAVDQEQALQAGQEYIAEYGSGLDIEIDPRLGLSSSGEVLAETGSLSVPVSSSAARSQDPAAAADQLAAQPDAQVCR